MSRPSTPKGGRTPKDSSPKRDDGASPDKVVILVVTPNKDEDSAAKGKSSTGTLRVSTPKKRKATKQDDDETPKSKLRRYLFSLGKGTPKKKSPSPKKLVSPIKLPGPKTPSPKKSSSPIRYTSPKTHSYRGVQMYRSSDDQLNQGMYVQPPILVSSNEDEHVDITFQPLTTKMRLHSSDSDGRYEVDTPLGRGVFGTVYAAKSITIDPSAALAAKVVSGQYLSNIDAEIAVMDRLRFGGCHPNVLKLLDVTYATNDIKQEKKILIVPRCKGTLVEYKGGIVGPFPEGVRMEIARQLYSGLVFIHERSVAHGDLHSNNVLVHVEEGVVKISDFGAARRVNNFGNEVLIQRVLQEDVLAMTNHVVIPLFISRTYGLPEDQETEALINQGYDAESIRMAMALIDNTRWKAFRGTNGASWEMDVVGRPEVEHIVKVIHRKELLTTGHYNKGIPIPVALHEPMRWGLKLAPTEFHHAAVISTYLDDHVDEPIRQAAGDFIRTGKIAQILL